MFKKYYLLFGLYSCFLCCVSAQVNLQTGSATFSLPMFSWQDDKSRLNSVVALNYNSGNGLKVDDVASNVGQGWSLIAGGVITRMQVGEPDDQKPYYNRITSGQPEIPEDETKYPAGYLYNSNDVYEKGCPLALTKYPLFNDKNHIYKQHNTVAMDRELDYFSFQFNGRSGMFVLSKNNNNNCLMLGDSKLKASFVTTDNMVYQGQGIRTTISTFTIQDENGLIYRFGKYGGSLTHGLTKVLKAGYCDANLIAKQTQPKFKHGKVYHESSFDYNDFINPYIINSWYLTEIEDALTHRKIIFNYSAIPLTINNSAGTSIAYYQENNYSIISHKFSTTQVPQLVSIKYPDYRTPDYLNGHLVAFNYGNARVDLLNDQVLASVDISYNGRLLSRYELNTSYFILNRYGTPGSNYQKSVARLCLMSVKKTGVDLKADENPYIFDYYLTSKNSPDPDDYVPPPFSCLKDIWGFYNGSYNGLGSIAFNGDDIPLNTSKLDNNQAQGLCFLRPTSSDIALNARSGYAKNGLLKQIIYPTGGTLIYEYDQNVGKLPGQTQDQLIGGVHVSKTKVTDGGYSNDCSHPILTNYDYTLSTAGPSSLWGLENPNNLMVVYNSYKPEKRGYKPPFLCDFKYKWPGILSRESKITISDWQKFMEVFSVVSDVMSVVMQVNDVLILLGPTPAGPLAVIIDIVLDIATFVISCIDTNKNLTSNIYYNSDLNGVNPLPAQFKRVEVVQNTGAIGKTVQEFTSIDDYSIWEPVNLSFSMKQRCANWAYGLPKMTTVLDVNGYTVKQVENRYDFSNAKNNVITFKELLNIGSCKCLVRKNYSQRNTDWEDKTKYDDPASYQTSSVPGILTVDPYYMYTGRVEDTATYERIYKPNSSTQYVETVTKYNYNSLNYQISKISIIQSNGNEDYKEIRYSSDFGGGIIDVLKNNNIVALPIKSTSSVKKNGDYAALYLSEKATEYTQLANGDIKPLKILEERTTQPQSYSNWISYNGPSNPSSAFIETQTFTYDGTTGNLTGMKDEGNHIVTNIYDYNDKYIIASVINADPLLDKPAYTSFETANLGGWVLTGTPIYAISSVTGARSFTLSTGKSLKVSTLNTARPYRLSLWATSAATVTGNATLVKSAPTINGFTYYEYNIAQGAANVTVSGSTTIDELRLYPATARMRTVTYDELSGKTSECDENNRITYYEYDESGRQKLIKDENKNIVKMFEYNTVSNKQSGCPGTYSNNKISEIFTKNNCGSGYIGSDITYTVPAAKYSSSISQADADQKAETEINTNGQTDANTNGSCIKLFYNVAKSESFTTEGCDVGYAGGAITYSVPPNKYTSIINQLDADQMAQDEIDANGQSYANLLANRVCNLSTTPDWEGSDTAQVRCQIVGSLYTGHLEAYIKDINPNSATYNTWAWQDVGPDETQCQHTAGTVPSLPNGQTSTSGAGIITGTPGAQITITVALNSSVSGASLTGNVGFNVSLSGSGTHNVTSTVTIPASGYISWSLNLSGPANHSYISSSMSIQ
jgi:hypothetical protein